LRTEDWAGKVKSKREANAMKITEYLALGLLAWGLAFLPSSFASEIGQEQHPAQKSGDFLVVSNPKAPKNPSMRMVFKEDLTIGVKEGDENYMFGSRFLYINVDDNGNIYVVDWDRKRIQKYGPDGKYLLTIGRKGQGPGEFQNVWAPHFDWAGNLYVRDIVNHKVSFFDPNGKLIKELKMPDKAQDIQVNSRGEYVGYISEEKSDPKLDMKVISSYGLFDRDLNPLAVFQQTTWTPANMAGRDVESQTKFLAESMSNGALAPRVTVLLGPDDRICAGYPETYEIRVYSPDGRPERLIRKDQPPRSVTGTHRKDYEARQERDFLSLLADLYPESIRKKALTMIRYPKYLPAYQTFTLMDNGWLAVVVDATGGGPSELDLFDEKGIYIGESEAPIPVEGLRFKKGKAYAVMTTEDGYKFVKRFGFEIKEN
jgi:hypothetical protein